MYANTRLGPGQNGAPPPYSVQPESPLPTGRPRPSGNTGSRPPRPHGFQQPQQQQQQQQGRPIDVFNCISRETQPLLPHRPVQKNTNCAGNGCFASGWWVLIAVLVAGFISGTIVTYTATKCDYCVEAGRMERIRADWELERLHHDTETAERDTDHQRWRLEDAAHEAKLAMWRQEDEERQSMGFFWANFEALNCVRHETREYRARLQNVPKDFEHRVQACRETEMSINGVMKKPTRCEDKGSSGLYGFWEERGEATCGTYFNWFKDKGCTARHSGLKKYEMYMENLRPGDDWQVMCSTTPASFMGMDFAHPHYCVKWGEGTYGLWDLKDWSCS